MKTYYVSVKPKILDAFNSHPIYGYYLKAESIEDAKKIVENYIKNVEVIRVALEESYEIIK